MSQEPPARTLDAFWESRYPVKVRIRSWKMGPMDRKKTRCLLIYPRFSEYSFWNYMLITFYYEGYQGVWWAYLTIYQ